MVVNIIPCAGSGNEASQSGVSEAANVKDFPFLAMVEFQKSERWQTWLKCTSILAQEMKIHLSHSCTMRSFLERGGEVRFSAECGATIISDQFLLTSRWEENRNIGVSFAHSKMCSNTYRMSCIIDVHCMYILQRTRHSAEKQFCIFISSNCGNNYHINRVVKKNRTLSNRCCEKKTIRCIYMLKVSFWRRHNLFYDIALNFSHVTLCHWIMKWN